MSVVKDQKKFHKSIIIKMETDTQYRSIKPVLQNLLKNNISFDIYIPENKTNVKNINKMYNKTQEIVKKDGFANIVRKVSLKKYYHLALLAPHYEDGISAKYYIKYSYGSSHSVKPNQTHHAHLLNHYHGYFIYNTRDAELFSNFSKTYLLPDLKHLGYKQKTNSKLKKQTILFLPSWEDQENLNWIVLASQKLKAKYHITVKLHPFGDFGKEANKSVANLKQEIRKVADEYYEEETSLSELLSCSDLVISDISGAVFDALYVGVPVVIYSKNIHRFDTDGIKSANAKYADEGYISALQTVNELIKEVPYALSEEYQLKQQELAKNIFRQNISISAVDSWMKIINLYLNDQVDQEYIALHNIMTDEFWHNKTEVERLTNELRARDYKIALLQSEINAFLGIKRSTRILAGNIKRKITK